ncbi:type II toxin-antitoxin system RelE family toxin [Candidatus Venteria ishoeyi]|uniref:mRNA interferase RelE n=1 Tax=Candidatus Venteria ishoeyi TaxID=1899563 RepID=A0A1H6FFQ5_9GAMM|nr:type II toxin-antitoxin system RelE/ParE family toxin [Candidatus Venteria ishoeyi]MDM8545056.1 type II toxin-antitoxin system RelE/ParE family toxin [Candidatus Venteria ishoeyi]SEH08179.1 mRNA interferase RelE [Candidatus Venteria ishoeyi]
MYRIAFNRNAAKTFEKLERSLQKRILGKIEALAMEPKPLDSRKIMGMDNAYRIKVGNYRIVYDIFDETLLIEVLRIGHRREVYRNLK